MLMRWSGENIHLLSVTLLCLALLISPVLCVVPLFLFGFFFHCFFFRVVGLGWGVGEGQHTMKHI